MDSTGSFVQLMERLRQRDDAAATQVVTRFVHRLVALAAAQFGPWARPHADCEEITQSVFKSFFHRQAEGQFELSNWEELWGLLAAIAVRKCGQRWQYLKAKRRDIARLVRRVDGPAPELWRALDRAPTPLEAAALVDSVEHLLRGQRPADRRVAERLLQGYTAEEIAAELACSERTVRRIRHRMKLRLQKLQEAEIV